MDKHVQVTLTEFMRWVAGKLWWWSTSLTVIGRLELDFRCKSGRERKERGEF